MVSSPLRSDSNPSVHIKVEADGKLLIKDFGEDYTRNNREIVGTIMEAWGLHLHDLYPPQQNTTYRDKCQITAIYKYLDEKGTQIFQVVRLQRADGSKSFYQRRPNRNGGWVNNMEGVNPVPYRLPELTGALKANKMIIICEGEKDCDRLCKLNFTATTNHGGAGKWRDEHSKYFPSGSKVTIIPDNDDIGRKHAWQVARSLHIRGCEVRILALPGLSEKQDVSDWLDAGNNKEQLLKLVVDVWEQPQDTNHWEEPMEKINSGATDESWHPVITCMRDIDEAPISWIWPGYIASRKLCIIEGDPSQGKTWVTLFLSAAVSRGYPLPDPDTGIFHQICEQEPANVIYMTAEDGLADTIKKRLVMLGADCDRIFVIEGQCQGEKAIKPVSMQDLDILRQAMRQIKPALLIFDPLQGFLGANVDMHRANETRPVLTGMIRLAEEFNCAVVIIRHLNKSNSGKVAYRGMGSIDFTATARTVLLVGKDPDDPHKRIIIPTKCNIGAEGVPIAFSLTPERGFEWAGKADNRAEDLLYPQVKEEAVKEKNAFVEAMDFLCEALNTDSRPIREVKIEAKNADISDRTLRRAREQLGVRSYKKQDQWYWYLPGQNG